MSALPTPGRLLDLAAALCCALNDLRQRGVTVIYRADLPRLATYNGHADELHLRQGAPIEHLLWAVDSLNNGLAHGPSAASGAHPVRPDLHLVTAAG